MMLIFLLINFKGTLVLETSLCCSRYLEPQYIYFRLSIRHNINMCTLLNFRSQFIMLRFFAHLRGFQKPLYAVHIVSRTSIYVG
jgi:hypothetical protein